MGNNYTSPSIVRSNINHAVLLDLTHTSWRKSIKNRWFTATDHNTKMFLKYLSETKRFALKNVSKRPRSYRLLKQATSASQTTTSKQATSTSQTTTSKVHTRRRLVLPPTDNTWKVGENVKIKVNEKQRADNQRGPVEYHDECDGKVTATQGQVPCENIVRTGKPCKAIPLLKAIEYAKAHVGHEPMMARAEAELRYEECEVCRCSGYIPRMGTVTVKYQLHGEDKEETLDIGSNRLIKCSRLRDQPDEYRYERAKRLRDRMDREYEQEHMKFSTFYRLML